MWRKMIMLYGLLALTGCSSYPALHTESHVNLERFMGNWYVIANIPTWIEKDAHNAMESYRLNPDGTIATTFAFHADSFEGEKKIYHPTGYVLNKKSNAVWGMQFIWPFKSDYRIVYVSPDYTETIIGRIKRDYVWIMARTPQISDADYQKLVGIIKKQGYDTSKLQKVPQKWHSL